jgi:hypothetical protein
MSRPYNLKIMMKPNYTKRPDLRPMTDLNAIQIGQ